VRVEQAAIVNVSATITAPVKIFVVMNVSSVGRASIDNGTRSESNSRMGMVVPDEAAKLSVRDVLSAALMRCSSRRRSPAWLCSPSGGTIEVAS
jgi:hypothetical protein